jgi:hypothetical protein
MNALGAELLLQFGPPFGDGLSISPLECGPDLNLPLATPKIDAQLGTGIGPKDGRHRCCPQSLKKNHLTRELIRQAGDRTRLGKRNRLRGLRQSIRLSNPRIHHRHSHRGISTSGWGQDLGELRVQAPGIQSPGTAPLGRSLRNGRLESIGSHRFTRDRMSHARPIRREIHLRVAPLYRHRSRALKTGFSEAFWRFIGFGLRR